MCLKFEKWLGSWQRFPCGPFICSLLLHNDRIFSCSQDCPAKEISWPPLKVGHMIKLQAVGGEKKVMCAMSILKK